MRRLALLALAAALPACGDRTIDAEPAPPTTDRVTELPAAGEESAGRLAAEGEAGEATGAAAGPVERPVGATLPDGTVRPANELGKIMVLEYHLVGDTETRWQRERGRFAQDLRLLYERGYRPVSVSELVDGELDLPAGLSPVVFTFDDASPSQFRYVEQADGSLVVDSTSALGIWESFARSRPDWRPRAVFCMLPAAEAGRSFFGDKGIEGQKTEWRFRKVKYLAEQGYELCNHTLWHANLAKYSDAFVQEQIARGVLAIDSVVPGYRVRTLALPLGMWPKNRDLAFRGSWTDPKTKKVTRYDFDAVLEVSGGPTRSPHDPKFTRPARLNRVQVTGKELERTLDELDRTATRYVSDGDPTRVARPAAPVAADASTSR